MTINEMHIRFKVGVDKLDTLATPNLDAEVVDEILNQAQERLVKQRIFGVNTHRTSFEETQKRMDDVRILVQNAVITPTTLSGAKPYAVVAQLPNTQGLEYWFTINEEAEVVYKDCTNQAVTSISAGVLYIVSGTVVYNGTTYTNTRFTGIQGVTSFTGTGTVYTATSKRVEVKPIRHDHYNKKVRDPFNMPDNNHVLRLAYQTYAELIGVEGMVIADYYLRYIRKPLNMSYAAPQVNCELPDHLHEEIVSTAVSIALEGIESGRYQTNLNELLKQE